MCTTLCARSFFDLRSFICLHDVFQSQFLSISPLIWIHPSPRIATMLHVLASMHNWTNFDFISISLPLLHNPLMGFRTWLGLITSGSIWTLSPNDLLNPHKIYENLLHHRGNDLDFLVARLFSISLWDITEIWARNHCSLWLFHNCRFWSWGKLQSTNCNFRVLQHIHLADTSGLKLHMTSLETSIRSLTELKLNLSPFRAQRETRLYLESETWRTPWRVMMHPSCEHDWIVPSPITLLVREFPMKTSPPWIEVYAENIFLLKLICCEHPELIIHLFLLPTDLSVTERTSRLSSSSPISSVTLASGCFFLSKSTINSSIPPFCDNSCTANSYVLSYP